MERGGLGFALRPAVTVPVIPACIKELGGRLRRWVGILQQPTSLPVYPRAGSGTYACFQRAPFAMAKGSL